MHGITTATELLVLLKSAKEELHGGLADNKSVADIAKDTDADTSQIKEQLNEGRQVEREHTKNDSAATEVAKDHLEENPQYYDDLEKMENEAKMREEAGPLKEDPGVDGINMILQFISESDDLDDESLHKLFYAMGIDPHEGEELVYAALQKYLQNAPCAVDPAEIEEVEKEEPGEEEQEEKEAYFRGFMNYMNEYGQPCLKKEAGPLSKGAYGIRKLLGLPDWNGNNAPAFNPGGYNVGNTNPQQQQPPQNNIMQNVASGYNNMQPGSMAQQ